MDNKNLKALKEQAEAMVSNMNGMLKNVDKLTKDTFKNISPEEALKFSKAMKEANVDEKVLEIQKKLKEMKSFTNF